MKLLALAILSALSPSASAQALDRELRKTVESVAADWFEARPKSCFDEWDASERAALLRRAEAVDAFPGAGLEELVAVLWKEVHDRAPRWKKALDTPYGEATWMQSGKGGEKAGLLVGLHGGGEGAGHASEAASNWRMKGQLSLYPQGIRLVHDTWNTVHGERFVLSLIEYAKAQHEIDPDRVYVAGFSMGSTGAWFMAGRHPDLFAGAIAGHGVFMASPASQVERKEEVQSLQHGLLPNVRDLAVYFYTGTKDTNCMPGTFLYAWDVLQDLRSKDRDGYENVRFALHEGLDHSFPSGEPEAGIDFVTAHRRDPFPSTLVWEYAADPFPLPGPDDATSRVVKRWYYWLHCDAPRDGMRVRATRDGNAIDLVCEGVPASSFTIYLNPSMIDVERPVRITVRGETVYEGRPEPSFATVLTSLDARLDRRLVFDRKVELP